MPYTAGSAAASSHRVRRLRRLIMSNTRPGVPDTMCTPASSLRMSSPTDLPPMHACACTGRGEGRERVSE